MFFFKKMILKYFIAYIISGDLLIVFRSMFAAIHIVIRCSAKFIVVHGIFSLIILYIVVRQQKN